MIDRTRYRYVNFVSGRVLEARECRSCRISPAASI